MAVYQFLVISQNVRYVLGTHDYLTRETSLLRFPAGAVIKLEEREGLDEGRPCLQKCTTYMYVKPVYIGLDILLLS